MAGATETAKRLEERVAFLPPSLQAGVKGAMVRSERCDPEQLLTFLQCGIQEQALPCRKG